MRAAAAKPRARAAVSVAPLRETPGISATACASPSASPSRAAASSCDVRDPRVRRRCVGERHRDAAREQPAAIDAGSPRRRSIGGRSASPASAGGASASAITARAAAVDARGVRAAAPRACRARAPRRAGVQRDLEGLARAPSSSRVAASRRARQQRGVGRGGDRQQLGRALQQPERDRLAERERAVGRRSAAPASAAASRRARRRRTSA